MRFEFRFSGSGGQGLMLLGDIMAQAAGFKEGKQIVLTKSYGPEARGSACRSEMIVADGKVNYPTVTAPDYMIAMSQKAIDAYNKDLKDTSIIIVDEDLVKEIPAGIKGQIKKIPLTRLAEEVTGKGLAANVVAIGALAAFNECLKPESIHEAVTERFKPQFKEPNDKAFEAGYNAALALK